MDTDKQIARRLLLGQGIDAEEGRIHLPSKSRRGISMTDAHIDQLVSLLTMYKKKRCHIEQMQPFSDSKRLCDYCALADYEQGFCAIDELLADIEKHGKG